VLTVEEFRATLLAPKTPPPVSAALPALWHDPRGDWDKAHELANDVDEKTGALVHAIYFGRNATLGPPATGTAEPEDPSPQNSLADEWDRIVHFLDAMAFTAEFGQDDDSVKSKSLE